MLPLCALAFVATLSGLLSDPLLPQAVPDGPSLSTYPRVVYKVADTGNQPLESWFFSLKVHGSESRPPVPTSLRIRRFAGDTLLETQDLTGQALMKITQRNFDDEVYDLPIIDSRPMDWGTDRIELELEVMTGGKAERLLHSVALNEYVQKTALVFPFRGCGLVTQGPFHDRGHYGPGAHFALDVIGLTPLYAPQVQTDETNEAYAGWGRDVIAPADGIVVRARGDIPNNPRPGETLDPAVLAGLPDPEPQFTVPGNHVVIDHGNGEFSVLMHLACGSVGVAAGDKVKQGDAVGRLGNSGDSFAPHLHYALQAGSELLQADPLPAQFTNLPGKQLVRGAYFDAK